MEDRIKLKAIIVDLDGTLAHRNGREWYEYCRCIEDDVDIFIKNMVLLYKENGADVIVVTGRPERDSKRGKCNIKQYSEKWLEFNNIPYDKIYTRSEGDYRPDEVIKKEIYEKYIKRYYDVEVVLDDRSKVVKMWREQGLKCLQVQEGDF